ncbi:MAG TPA: hypothetical protein EYP14_15575, partial [Planctomycetaceae bacterium]|nr:hypothetical protein [Planctomycetaceae bacterium]
MQFIKTAEDVAHNGRPLVRLFHVKVLIHNGLKEADSRACLRERHVPQPTPDASKSIPLHHLTRATGNPKYNLRCNKDLQQIRVDPPFAAVIYSL